MIRVINITTNTRPGDSYDIVAINPFPIVIINSEENLEDLYKDADFIDAIKKHIKTKSIYHKSKLYIRTINSDYESIDEEVKLDEVIPIEYVD